jgi:hypothetical protein
VRWFAGVWPVDLEIGRAKHDMGENCFALRDFFGITIAPDSHRWRASVQAAPTSPPMKTIGTPNAAAKPACSRYSMNSYGATLQGDTLVLSGVMLNSIIFADRPVRTAGHQPTADMIAELGFWRRRLCQEPAQRNRLGPRQGRGDEGCRGGTEESEA